MVSDAPVTQADTAPTVIDVLNDGSEPAATQRAAWPTGFDPLDDLLRGGFHAGELVVVGGRPGVGKTVAALQWARAAATRGRPVVYVCYEHTPRELVGRLLCLELGVLARPDELPTLAELRRLAQEFAIGAIPLDALTAHPLGEEACGHVARYGASLRLVEASPSRTGTEELAALAHGVEPAAVFVDYLQKVALRPAIADESERTTRITEALKEIALRLHVPVVALAAADREGLTSRRLRLHHLRGSTALAHEPDVIILLNEKSVAVSKSHLAYDPVRADRYRRQVVFSVEKNRSGPPDLDLEFSKDFAGFRFDPVGGFLAEKLVDDVLYNE